QQPQQSRHFQRGDTRMLKKNWCELLGYALVALLIAVFLTVSLTHPPQQNPTGNNASQNGPDNTPWWEFSGFWIAWFTVVLTVATAGLWRVTGKAADAAKDAAIAAKQSADAAVAAERARFFVTILKHDSIDRFITSADRWDKSPGMPMEGDVRVEYCFKNYG